MRKLDEKKRKLITSVARGHFKKNGFKGASMTKIAADSYLAVGTLYLYFPSKGELLKSTVEDFVLEHKDQISAVLKSRKSASSKLKHYLKYRLEAVSEVRNPENSDSELNQKIFELFPSRRAEESAMMVDTISQIIASGKNSGEFIKIKKTIDEVFVFMHSIAWFFLPSDIYDQSMPNLKDLDRVVEWFIDKWVGEK